MAPSSTAVDTNRVLKCSQHLLQENFKQLNAFNDKYGPEFTRTLICNFIACFIGGVLHNSLTQKPENLHDKQEIYEYVQANFSEFKMKIQEAVAAGFTGAMNQFSGKELEYYCRIMPVGKPINREPC